MSSQSTASNAEKVVRQRGPSRGVTGRDFMVLEFDDFGKDKGQWAPKYGQHIGQCASRIDINIDSYLKIDEVEKKRF